jgi:hypothetical protein
LWCHCAPHSDEHSSYGNSTTNENLPVKISQPVIIAEILPIIAHDKKEQIAELLNALECIPAFGMLEQAD